jgi:hypothetical protein
MSSASAAMERKPQPPTKPAVADFIQGPGPDPTLQMSTLEMLASWYSGEDLDAGEVRSLWLRTVAALVGLWVLSHFAPS